MAQAKKGDQVSVHYTGKLDDGTVFDSSDHGEPLVFVLGTGQVLPGFENAILGMNSGDSKTVKIAAREAYGLRQEDLVMNVDRGQIPPDLDIETGQRLQMEKSDGETMRVTVTSVSEEMVTLDGNHPLAGEDLTFDITLVKITE